MSDWVGISDLRRLLAMSRAADENGHPQPLEGKMRGVGSENWGCGGNMTPEQYG